MRYEFREDDPSVHQAAKFALVMGVLGVAFMALAAAWTKHCHGVDAAACSMPYRTALALGGPAILFGGGVWAFVRTYQAWRHYRTWFAWQGAGWFLLVLMSVVLTMSLPVLLL
ncbi:hypothetical protein ABIA30_001327 [Mycobacterium sp. MAA66]|uniref:hypothetical protein n=1 Tax=Mycobacterium sp. MAA66 TaxID=3156297 RepID=UPI003511068A